MCGNQLQRRSDADRAGTTRLSVRRPLLLPRHQTAIAVLALAGLIGMACNWLAGQFGGGLVEIDDAPPLEARFFTDINTAEWTELAELPEIGETLARRIVESRNQHGPFQSHNDLLRVSGIGEKTLEKIRPNLQPIESAPP